MNVGRLQQPPLDKSLFPFSFSEVQQQFQLDSALNWGQLPKIYYHSSDNAKKKFL